MCALKINSVLDRPRTLLFKRTHITHQSKSNTMRYKHVCHEQKSEVFTWTEKCSGLFHKDYQVSKSICYFPVEKFDMCVVPWLLLVSE